MTPYISVRFATGHTFLVPTKAIIDVLVGRRRLILTDSEESISAELQNEFADHSNLVAAFATLAWDDIASHARLIDFVPPDFNKADVLDVSPSLGAEPTLDSFGENGLQVPIEMLLSGCEAKQSPCAIFGFPNPQGLLRAAAVGIVGADETVKAYLAALQSFDQFMAGQSAATATH